MLDAFGVFSLVGATIFFLKDNNFTDIKKKLYFCTEVILKELLAEDSYLCSMFLKNE